MMFMVPLAIGNAASTLVAQRIGADDPSDARRLGWHGLELGVLIAASVSAVVSLLREPILNLYTHDAVIIKAALPLLAWVVVFHIADAAQTVSAFVLRAYRVATAPMVIYAVAIWGVGLGGGYAVAFDTTGAIANSFGNVQLTPTSVLINKRGEIVKRYVGEPDFVALNQLVEKLLAET